MNNDCVEKDTLINESKICRLGLLKNFRQLSLSHILFTHIENLMSSDYFNSKKFLNVFFTGGVLKTPFLKELIKEDINNLITHKNFNINFSEIDPTTSFFKGANYISKIPDLENIMVSRQDYFDLGSEHLSYNYI